MNVNISKKMKSRGITKKHYRK